MCEYVVNYRDVVLTYLNVVENRLLSEIQGDDIDSYEYACRAKALRMTRTYFNKFFDVKLKHYNGNESRAYDEFVYEKALEQFEFYVLNMLGEVDLGFEKMDKRVKKEMRILLGHLQAL